MAEYPRIWDWSGERKIVGETKVSWIVVERRYENAAWVASIESLRLNPESAVGWVNWAWIKKHGVYLVSKKKPNGNAGSTPTWFFSEAEWTDVKWAYEYRRDILREIEYKCPPAILRQIAKLIGYKESQ